MSDLPFETAADLAHYSEAAVPWVMPGVVALGSITELDAKIKAGKTTLLLNLSRAVLDGVDFLGQPTSKRPVLYLTEQPRASFKIQLDGAELLGREDFHILFWHGTVGTEWSRVAKDAVG